MGDCNKFLIVVLVYFNGFGEGVVVGEYDISIVIGMDGVNFVERVVFVGNNFVDCCCFV